MTRHWLELISPSIRPAGPGIPFLTCTNHAIAADFWLEALRVIYDHELVFFAGELFIVEIEGMKYECPPGSFIIIPSGRWHVSYNAGKRVGHRYWAHFDWVYQGPYGRTPVVTFHPATPQTDLFRFAPDFVPKGIIAGKVPNLKRAIEIHERLTMMQQYGSTHGKVVSRALLMELLLEILDPGNRTEAVYGDRIELAERVRNALENAVWSAAKTPPIQRILGGLGYSYAHLCRSFGARYGITPIKFVHTLQITRAKMLLTDTDLPVSEIGYRTGFDNPAYFTLLFRKMTQTTPSQYRKEVSGSGT